MLCILFLLYQEPSAPPDNVRGHFTSSTEIFIQWDEVPVAKRHGDIKSYMVTYQKTEGGEEKTATVNSPTREVKLAGLGKYSYYSIRVSAATVKGYGPASPPIKVRTDEDSK